MNENQGRNEHNGALGGTRATRLKILGMLPAKLQASAKENPRVTLVAVGAVAFALGGIAGSRLGRFALAISLPIVISRVLDGSLSRELARWATGIPEVPPT